MILNPVNYAEQEYQQPFSEIVAGYASDGESLARVASILHVELNALQHYAVSNGIQFTGHNCPAPEPSRNRKQARRALSDRYCFRGLDLTPIEWQERTGIPADTIRKRIARGWDPAKAVTTKPLTRNQVARLGVRARSSK